MKKTVKNLDEVIKFVRWYGFPIILKSSFAVPNWKMVVVDHENLQVVFNLGLELSPIDEVEVSRPFFPAIWNLLMKLTIPTR